MKNQYGLDINYMQRNLERILRSLVNLKPDEFARSMMRLAVVADEKVLTEMEFKSIILASDSMVSPPEL